MKPKAEDSTQKMQTLLECLKKAGEDGYRENFRITTRGLVAENAGVYKPTDVSIPNFYRFEGYSDPEDSSILYLVQTTDGKKGTILDAYGMYADAAISSFIRKVQEIHKKIPNGTQSLIGFVRKLLTRRKDPSLVGS